MFKIRIFSALAATCLIGAVVAPTASAASNDAVPARYKFTEPRVVVVGDSLSVEMSPTLAWVSSPRKFVPRNFGGTAPCDWTRRDLGANSASVVVISFTGNSLTPCMSNGRGGMRSGQEVVDQYRIDVAKLITKARRSGASVVLVGQPARPAGMEVSPGVDGNWLVDQLNSMYREFAVARNVSFVDAGSFVENADGSYAAELPCAPFDQVCGPNGMTPVRGDGVHFCPVWYTTPCPVYSGGAVRFAFAIADAVANPKRYE